MLGKYSALAVLMLSPALVTLISDGVGCVCANWQIVSSSVALVFK